MSWHVIINANGSETASRHTFSWRVMEEFEEAKGEDETFLAVCLCLLFFVRKPHREVSEETGSDRGDKFREGSPWSMIIEVLDTGGMRRELAGESTTS